MKMIQLKNNCGPFGVMISHIVSIHPMKNGGTKIYDSTNQPIEADESYDEVFNLIIEHGSDDHD